jgi:pimeloyl-ACP methyl ester carboxylesterase
MSELAFTRTGTGPPLVLLHGIGCSRRSWDPVIPALAEHFDVLAVDLPGFGDSPCLATHVKPTPAALAAAVGEFLAERGVSAPHVAGNSLGGWVALELAGMRPAASVTLLSPAGLWRKHTPRYCRLSLRLSRGLARHCAGLLGWVVRWRLGRMLVLGQTHGHPTRITAAEAGRIVRTLGTCPGFDAAFKATLRRCYSPSTPVSSPVTVAFGTRDWLLLRRQSRHLDALPVGSRLEALPGCGHLPMADDPCAVTALITVAAGHPLSARLPTPDAAQPPGRPLSRSPR